MAVAALQKAQGTKGLVTLSGVEVRLHESLLCMFGYSILPDALGCRPSIHSGPVPSSRDKDGALRGTTGDWGQALFPFIRF